jgi:cobalt-zinc-cadmium resistance protein CzcA
MLRGLIAFCLLRRPLVLVVFGAFLGLGVGAFTTLNIEAYPDPAPPIVEIIAQRPGQSPEEMERYVTIPIEIAIASTPGLRYIRSNTVYALSFIRLQFEYGRDYHFVRQQTINRLREADLPQGVQPVISPAGTISEIFRHELKGPPDMDVMQLKTLQGWVVERRLRIVPGVSDVLVLGGKTKEFQAEIDLNRMRAFGVSVPQIINAIATNNANVGGRTIAMGEQAVNVRGLGVVRSLEDIGNIVLTQQGGLPVLVSDVAKMQLGFTPRLGIAGRDDTTDIVTGIVLMQKFERTMDVVQRVREAVTRLNTDGTLPRGVHIDAFYDRGDLVAITVRTVLNNMLFGVVLIFLIQWIFLGNLRSAVIVSATIPAALLLAVIITVLRGESANLLSIGAIDLGIIVDATVIMVENIFRHLAQSVRREVSDPETRLSEKLRRILAAAAEVDRAIFFSVIITIAAFLPLFTMQGVEGQIFGPMSRTYAYALLGAVIGTFTVTPVISSLLLPERVSEVETFLVRQIRKVYHIVLPLAVRRYRLSAAIGLAFLAICGTLATRLGTEFLPKLEEGNLWIRGMMPPTIALDAGIETVARIRNIIRSYDPVRTVFSEQGRGEDGTDPDGPFLVEFFVPLKPFNEWPRGLTKPKLIAQMSERLNREIVGVDFNFSQYIQDNIEEAVSGVKGENSMKIFGRDLTELERLSQSVKAEIARVPGVRDPAAFNLIGQPNLVIRIDRAKAARYGISVGDVNAVVQAAIGGQEITRVYEGEMHFALTVRLAPRYRDNVNAIRTVPVAVPNADSKSPTAYIALSDLAEVKLESGASYIYRENSQRFVPLKYSVRERDLGSTVPSTTPPCPGRGAAAGLPDGMDGRVRRIGGGQESAGLHRAAQPIADNDAVIWLVQFHTGQCDHALRHSVCGRRRNFGTLRCRPQCQRLSRRWIHLAVRRVCDGRHPARVLYPPRARRRDGDRAGDHQCWQIPHAAGLHDRIFCVHRASGSDLHWHRLPGAAAAGLRDCRRHAAVADLQPARDPDARPAADADDRGNGCGARLLRSGALTGCSWRTARRREP